MAKKKSSKPKIITKTVKVKGTHVPATKKRKGYYRDPYKKKIKEFANDEVGFMPLAKKVAKNYVGKSVPSKYQDEYGKRYSKAEALEVGKKVAAKVRQQRFKKAGAKLARKKECGGKMEKGGLVNPGMIITGHHKI